MDKHEATVVMINELERLFKEKYNNNSIHDEFVTSVINMVFKTINDGIIQIENNFK